ncbi:hypothetical protein M885DRAFT_188778 [Pelagophyceae sp. CCMP2097]|nr:hypothetical protein M885DRAFT_188778 [Pelagophyceae sp. CCMP2097]
MVRPCWARMSSKFCSRWAMTLRGRSRRRRHDDKVLGGILFLFVARQVRPELPRFCAVLLNRLVQPREKVVHRLKLGAVLLGLCGRRRRSAARRLALEGGEAAEDARPAVFLGWGLDAQAALVRGLGWPLCRVGFGFGLEVCEASVDLERLHFRIQVDVVFHASRVGERKVPDGALGVYAVEEGVSLHVDAAVHKGDVAAARNVADVLAGHRVGNLVGAEARREFTRDYHLERVAAALPQAHSRVAQRAVRPPERERACHRRRVSARPYISARLTVGVQHERGHGALVVLALFELRAARRGAPRPAKSPHLQDCAVGEPRRRLARERGLG